jgi:hypothetical protein
MFRLVGSLAAAIPTASTCRIEGADHADLFGHLARAATTTTKARPQRERLCGTNAGRKLTP